MENLLNLSKRKGKHHDASQLNRSYQAALMDILATISKPSDETRLAILKAEDIAFKIEMQIGKEFRKPQTAPLQQCKYQLDCVHFERK